MLKVIQAPPKYIQGPDALLSIGKYTKTIADHVFVIIGNSAMKLVGDTVHNSLEEYDITSHFEVFGGECSRNEIQRLSDILKENECQAVIGIGGGKVQDTAKVVAYESKLPILIAPTISSTNAPTSALSVIYTDDGEYEDYLFFPTNPDIVLVDTALIAKAPTRFLVAGIGDSLATYFEARGCNNAHKPRMTGGGISRTAMALAHLCYETLLEDGYKAKLAVDAGVSTPAVENVIEASIYLSGLGFENTGIAAAHSVHNGFTVLEECHHMYHGEKVAFGVLVQLILENSPNEELDTVLDFCVQVGLPVTLDQLGVKDGEKLKEKVMAVAKASCAEGETIHNMPFEVTPEKVYAAILAADRMGRDWLY
ncbi:Glycerol dehydrogenase [Photorhabdus australis subsp. thailandensis]|uniref:Glycerol dehydrogenase n=1 Tax=Photorhabdus australis subsp. thailandensis TaxID=2805096 RepID=A0A1C0U3I1_9GAMM|nr:glycerol dehydrogenase [Photorhabdus australis]OCQ52451.1 Glycerol dehydrogenase [Photorhabdus australis subsp. thailandensis]